MNATNRLPVDRSPARLKVLDLGTVVAGPFAATVLGDLGAEVIKVERPDGGDTLRYARTGTPGMSNQWLVEGRNKRSVTLNLRDARGQQLVKRLASWADVLVENFQPGTMAKWGLSYPELRDVNPRLVYVSVSGYGQTGPKAAMPGFDQAATAYSGLTYLTGYPDRPPASPGYPVADYFCGTFAALGALEAVRRRDAGSGEGEWVDCALYAPLLRISADVIGHYATEGVVRDREGGMPGASPKPNDVTWAYVYKTLDDKWITLTALPDHMFPRLTDLLGRPDMLANEELRTSIGRRNNVHLIDAAIREWAATRTQSAAIEELTKCELPHSPVNNIADLCADPHVRARGDIVDVPDEHGRAVTMQGIVPTLTNHPGEIRWPGERLGASNADVYEGLLGLKEEELQKLKSEGVV
jgi:crotonobetainyl-CoA:carnitine CoA-transferase CaiB-like acyl-CoA transferase